MSIEMKMEYLATIFTPQFDAQVNYILILEALRLIIIFR